MRRDDLVHEAEESVRAYGVEELQSAGLIPRDGSYYPAIYYPPIPMYQRSTPEEVLEGFAYDPARPFSVYVHIPFCVSKCSYCHWVVYTGKSENEIEDYLDKLAAEMRLYKRMLGVDSLAPSSILIGGGTPSILSPALTKRLFRTLRSEFDLSRCSQITCELEPTTVLGTSGLDKLKVMKAEGVDRVSLGVQSFHDSALRAMGRQHSARDAARGIEQIRQAGIESLSLDLIYGYSGCTPGEWLETLRIAFSLDIDACQLYRLRIVPHGEKTGAVKKAFDSTPYAFPAVEDVYVMKQLGIMAAAENGLAEMSRRVFARDARHNSDYLTDHTDGLGDVFGIGISAWSNLGDRFFVNVAESLEKYSGYVKSSRMPIAKGRIRTKDDQRRWAVAVPLKHHGVSKEKYRSVTGEDVSECFGRRIESLKRFGLVRDDEDRLQLTRKGCFFADEVAIQFYHPTYLPFPRHLYAEGELNPYRD